MGQKILTLQAWRNCFDVGRKGEGRIKEKTQFPSLSNQGSDGAIPCHPERDTGFTASGRVHLRAC